MIVLNSFNWWKINSLWVAVCQSQGPYDKGTQESLADRATSQPSPFWLAASLQPCGTPGLLKPAVNISRMCFILSFLCYWLCFQLWGLGKAPKQCLEDSGATLNNTQQNPMAPRIRCSAIMQALQCQGPPKPLTWGCFWFTMDRLSSTWGSLQCDTQPCSLRKHIKDSSMFLHIHDFLKVPANEVITSTTQTKNHLLHVNSIQISWVKVVPSWKGSNSLMVASPPPLLHRKPEVRTFDLHVPNPGWISGTTQHPKH